MISAGLGARSGSLRRSGSVFFVVMVVTATLILSPQLPTAEAQDPPPQTFPHIPLASTYAFLEAGGQLPVRIPDRTFGRRAEVLSNTLTIDGVPLMDAGPFEFGTTDTVIAIHSLGAPPETMETFPVTFPDVRWESENRLRVRVGRRIERWDVEITPSALVEQPFGEALVNPNGLNEGEMELALRLMSQMTLSRGDEQLVLDAGRRRHRRAATFYFNGADIPFSDECDEPFLGPALPLFADRPCPGFSANGFQGINLLTGSGGPAINLDHAVPELGTPPQVPISVNVGDGSHLGSGVVVAEGASIGNNVLIGPNTFVGNNVNIGNNTIIGNGVRLEGGGERGGGLQIGSNIWIGSNSVIGEGALINNGVGTGDGISIGDSFIGQDTVIGGNSSIGGQSQIGTDVNIGRDVQINEGATIDQGIFIADGDVIADGSRITENRLTCHESDETVTVTWTSDCSGAVQECAPTPSANPFSNAPTPAGQNLTPGQLTTQARADLARDIDASGIAQSNGGVHQYVETTHDCEDFAKEMEEYLTALGYNATITLKYRRNPDWAWYKIFTDKWLDGHAINDIHLADGTTIWIEPQLKSTEGAFAPINTDLDYDKDGKVEFTTGPADNFAGTTDDGWRIEVYDNYEAGEEAGVDYD